MARNRIRYFIPLSPTFLSSILHFEHIFKVNQNHKCNYLIGHKNRNRIQVKETYETFNSYITLKSKIWPSYGVCVHSPTVCIYCTYIYPLVPEKKSPSSIMEPDFLLRPMIKERLRLQATKHNIKGKTFYWNSTMIGTVGPQKCT